MSTPGPLKAGMCHYVLVPNSAPGGDPLLYRRAIYCGAPTKWRMQDGCRVYDAFCPTHRAVVDAMPQSEEDDV